MRPRALCHFVFALVFAPLFATAAAAQTSATIAGTIDDPNRSVLPGVTVTVRNVATSLSRTVATNGEGRYVIAGLPPGAYELRAELTSFKPHVRRDLQLTIAQALVVNITLEVGGLSEEVTVAGDTSLVNTSSAELSFLVGSEAIDQLPLNGRNYTDLALMQPGVLAYPHRDGGSVVAHGLAMSVNGQDPRSNVYLLDGTLQNDFTNGPAGSAAGTALGTETVREFRVESNAYSAEFGRNSGGQINVLTKSGANNVDGSVYEFHRNEALDARNYFDAGEQPDFHRNQFGGTVGGPIARDRAFFFLGYEALVERLGKTISTVVPDDNARTGLLPTGQVPVSPQVAPYLAEYPVANGPSLGQGIASYTFPFNQRLDEHFAQGRIDYSFGGGTQLFARYTIDDTDQFLPTDYPQFPRNFISRNQFFTSEYRRIVSPNTVSISRIGFSRTRIGQNVQANTSQPLPTFVATRDSMGDIDIGGLRRFGPQSSGNLRLVQNVFSAQSDLIQTRGRHVLKAGALAEHYQDNMVNPTFSLGIFTFADLSAFLGARAASFVGLTPEAQFDRYWRFTLFGFYLQDDFRISPRVTVNAGLRYEFTTMPREKYNRDSALPDLSASEAGRRSALRESHLHQPVAASGRGVGCLRQRSNRRSRRLRALLQHQQPSEPDRDGDQSAVHAAPGHRQPDVPEPALRSRQCHLDAAGAVRPGQPARAHLQRQRAAGSLGTDRRHYRLRRLARPAPAAQRRRQPRAADRHHRRRPAIHRRRNAADQPVVLDHRAEEQRRRLVVQRVHLRSAPPLEPGPFAAVVVHVLEERGHHAGLDLLLRRDQRHHVGAARVRARLQPRTVRLRHPPQLGHELHRGAARRRA